jgi:hypothetical protein
MSVSSVVLLIGCKSDNEVPSSSQESSAIRVSSTVGDVSGLTRAPYLNQPSESNPLKADIFVSENQGDYADLWNDNNYPDGSGAHVAAQFTSKTGPGFADVVQWPMDPDTELYFVGTSPQNAFVLDTPKQKGDPVEIATAAVTGYKDLLYTGEESAHKKSGGVVPLTFLHTQVLCKLYLRAESSQAITNWGKLTKAEVTAADYETGTGTKLAGIPKELVLTLANGGIELGTTPLTELSFYKMDNSGMQEMYTDDAVDGKDVDNVDVKLSTSKDLALGYVMIPVDVEAANNTTGIVPTRLRLQALKLRLTSETYSGNKGEMAPATTIVDITQAGTVGGKVIGTSGTAVNIFLKLRENGGIEFTKVTVAEWGKVGSVTGEIGG